MSAPPIGMMISTPSTNAIAVMTMNGSHWPSFAGEEERDAEADHHDREHEVQQVLALEHHRRAGEQAELLAQAGELAEGDHRAGEGDRADERADEELELVAGRDRVGEVERRRVVARPRSRSAPRPCRRASASPRRAPASASSRPAARPPRRSTRRSGCATRIRSIALRDRERRRDRDQHADRCRTGCRGAPTPGATAPSAPG